MAERRAKGGDSVLCWDVWPVKLAVGQAGRRFSVRRGGGRGSRRGGDT